MIARQFATFYLDEVLWGIDVLQIREILEGIEIFPVPKAPNHIHGLMNLRGQIVTIIDLGARVGQAAAQPGERRTYIILKSDADLTASAASNDALERVGSDAVGLLVDRMADVVDLQGDQIDLSPANTGRIERRFVAGVARLEDELMLVLVLREALGS